MRSFKDILTESKKTYEFKLGFAGELPEGFTDRLEMGLKRFGLVNVSTGKKTPIQEKPLDFPQLQNMEVTYFEAEVEYPTTTQVLEEYLSNLCVFPKSHVIVRNANDPRIDYQENKEDTVYEPMLTTEDMGGESAQDQVAGNRIMDLLKELEVARKEREHDGAAGAPTGESKDIGDTENTNPVLGG
jgi:hypothetical protein